MITTKPMVLLSFVTLLGNLEANDFIPPAAYPIERYEANWSKNPFTLKTAPVAIAKESFAKDWVLGSMYQVNRKTTVILVNTKTRERISITDSETAANGMSLKKIALEDTKKESYVIVQQDGDEATLRYDDAFLKQLLTSNAKHNSNPVNSSKSGSAKLPSSNSPPPIPPPIGSNPAVKDTTNVPPILPQKAVTPSSASKTQAPIPTQRRRRMLTAPVSQ